MTTNKQLRELAEKATPGPWVAEHDKRWGKWSVISDNPVDSAEREDCGVFYCLADEIGGHVHGENFDDYSEVEANARFFAAANPATILALLDENEALQAECEKLRKLATECADYLDTNDMTSISHGSILHRKLLDAARQGDKP